MGVMRRIAAGVVIATLAVAVMPASAGQDEAVLGARAALRDTIGALLSRHGTAPIHVLGCRPSQRPGWSYCRAHVSGTAHCKVRLMIRTADGNYRAYATRLRCR